MYRFLLSIVFHITMSSVIAKTMPGSSPSTRTGTAIVSPSSEGKWTEFAEIEFDKNELLNGFSAEEIFSSRDCVGITFDDLIVLPGAIDFGVGDVVRNEDCSLSLLLYTIVVTFHI